MKSQLERRLTDVKEDRALSLRRKTVVTVISKIGDRRPQSDSCLVVIYGQQIGRRFRIKRGEVLIGRSSQAQIQIDHESVSRRHAQVAIGDQEAVVRDLGSTNGTYVNDEPVTERVLRDGDLIKVGRTILKYLSNDNIEGAYHEELYRLSTIDGLTRCFNKRYMRDQLARECSRAVRYERPLSLIMFDVDNFKELNDEYGHLAGDAVLTQMGKRILRRVRREDVLARVDGGEFAIVAPEITKEEAVELSERLVQLVNEGSFGFDEVQIRVGISVAVVSLHDVDEASLPSADAFGGGTTTSTHSAAPSLLGDLSETGGGMNVDRFAVLSEGIYALARQRLQEAKSVSRGRVYAG